MNKKIYNFITKIVMSVKKYAKPEALEDGETDSYQHDAAIVYGKKTDYVIVVFAQVGEYTGINGIKEISGMVYERLN